ncbi:ROK family glucokinase [Inconstantimicrobium porci]|uniref:Glucokinase n=1 Tax=Inconstantimicrobium porci TaxID=2652291 RepID=A0A7X2T2V5_9CLOT|nr:ROK family glucokinase [Inconstantimicrobium porci]MDD6769721.1 ROK family glucokinase [Inconstantimicrobium porci]MSR92640.1 ROK family glucokinase [Inconstantimicrobium porci]
MEKYAVGVDIGGTTVKIGLFTIEGKVLSKWEIETRKESNGKYILSDIAKSLDEEFAKQHIEKDEVKSIGVGVPGPVTEDGKVLGCVNIGWDVFNIEEALTKETGICVKAGNDANVAALGELWQGGGKGCSNMVMVTLGTGVGGGIIVNGKIIAGTNGAAGEIGHITVCKDEKEACNCGKHGCLEQYTSATGIVRLAVNALKTTDKESGLRKFDVITAKDVFDLAKSGDQLALEIVDHFADTLGSALAQISCVVDPEIIVIGGGVSKAGEIITDNVKKYYQKNAFHASRNTEFRLALLGNDAGIYGAAKLGIDK